MKKTDLRYIVDSLMFVSMVGIAVIGFFLGFIIPKGPAVSESGKYFLGLHRHDWGDIHLYLAVFFTALAVLHLILAWSWVKGKTRQLFGERWKIVLLSLPVCAVAVIIALWAVYPGLSPGYEDHGLGLGRAAAGLGLLEGEHSSVEGGEVGITGQSSLLDVERDAGVPAREIADALGLPEDAPLDEKLGRLRKAYPFTVDEVRDAVAALSNEPSTELSPAQPASPNERVGERQEGEEVHELPRGRMAQQQIGVLVTGQMTLHDLEVQTGVSARQIAVRLGLPPDTPRDERLGRLRRVYGFTMQDVREAVSALVGGR